MTEPILNGHSNEGDQKNLNPLEESEESKIEFQKDQNNSGQEEKVSDSATNSVVNETDPPEVNESEILNLKSGEEVFSDAESIDEALEEIVESSGIEAELNELKDSYLRLKADFENFKKRTAKQESELIQRANNSLIEKLLPALDVYDLALAHLDSNDPQANFEGLRKAFEILIQVLTDGGLEKIDKVGEKFSPELHEAVSHVKSEDSQTHEESVKEVYRAGYMFKGRVIRPATVIVES
jgi:molecular chaperone GrpE